MRRVLLFLGAAMGLPGGVPAQNSSPAALEALLEKLVGHWEMRGTVRNQPVTYRMDGARALQSKFVELKLEDVSQPPAYEARVFLGADSTRLIVHWLDRFGAALSIPHGIGSVRGDTLQFTFAYATGPFRDTFVYDRRTDSWHLVFESGDSTGGWKLFANYQAKRRP